VRATPIPEAWRAIIERELPHYRRLSADQCAKLLGDVHVFIAEKTIVGIDGFVVDDRAKVLVAVSAALLVLGRDIAMFDHVTRVVIHPDILVVGGAQAGGQYQAMRSMVGDEVVETWGEVEIAWTQIESAFATPEGQNTALHELAHAFDHADGKLDALISHEHYDRWRAKLHQLPLGRRIEGWTEITEVIADVDGPELFASATELFFECPRKLHRIDGALFEAMCGIYGLDPRTLVDH
jgi:Mlc titration factor MtfA (ptsG expression regulator)